MNKASDSSADPSRLISVLAVVGVGLIGGSFAAALRRAGAVKRIVGVGRSAAALEKACAMGLIDEAVSMETACAQADLMLIATPVSAVGHTLEQARPFLRPDMVITDACSTKADVIAAARAALGDRIGQFVPGHPIAGAEQTGPAAADAMLYRGRNVLLTPLPENSHASRILVSRAWEACGARVLNLDADRHDTVLASVSHVPHFLSSVYMWQVAMAPDADVRMGMAGSGFRDFTRISAGSAEVWRDIFLSNRRAVLAELQEVKAALERAEAALQESDGRKLEDFLERAALARRLWASRSGQS